MTIKYAQPHRTCVDCFHCQACHMWSSGAISATVAERCPQFEPVRYETFKTLRDLYKMHKGEVAPVRHGEWEHFNQYDKNAVLCSECEYPFGRIFPANYCPNCGAKMDGGKVNG